MCLCLWLQNNLCNATGSPHTDLFPLNNGTLEVDIYKGVSVVIITTKNIYDAYKTIKRKIQF